MKYITEEEHKGLLKSDFPIKKILGTKWKHEEIEFSYTFQKNKILVWKYYIRNLLYDVKNP